MATIQFPNYQGVLLAMLLLVAACAETEQPNRAEDADSDGAQITMAEDSELALLMRQLTAETDSIRAAIAAGKTHPLWQRVREIHTATPTDSTSSGPVFNGFAAAFVGAVEEMQNADSLHAHYFNAVIDRCMDCHQSFCPGPMKRIRKFYLPVSAR